MYEPLSCVCSYSYCLCVFLSKSDEPALKKVRREVTSSGNGSNEAVKDERGEPGEGVGRNGEGAEKGDEGVGVAKSKTTLSEVNYMFVKNVKQVYIYCL